MPSQKSAASPLQIAVEGNSVFSERILVRRVPIGYVCIGLGKRAGLLLAGADDPEISAAARFAEDCREIDHAIKTNHLTFPPQVPLGRASDPYLRRLAIASALLKAGFDPNQPRDTHGLWTSVVVGAAAGAAMATGVAAASDGEAPAAATAGAAAAAGVATADAGAMEGAGWAIWNRAALRLLSEVVGAIGAPIVIAGGLIAIPLNRSQMTEGTLPGRPDVSFRIDELEIHLYRTDEQGKRTLFFVGRRDGDGVYHDDEGRIVGRTVDGTFVLDPVAAESVPAPAEGGRAKEKDPAEVRAQAAMLAATTAQVRAIDRARLCPDPEFDREHGASPRAEAYQTQVTRMPPGLAFYLDDVSFDGCRYWGDGAMLEAKGEGVGHLVTPRGWPSFWDDPEKDLRQMERQAKAAAEAHKYVEWHVSDKPYADYLASYADRNFTNVVVIWEPAIPTWRPANRKFEAPTERGRPFDSIARSRPYAWLGLAVGA